jgi:hypothetical protein
MSKQHEPLEVAVQLEEMAGRIGNEQQTRGLEAAFNWCFDLMSCNIQRIAPWRARPHQQLNGAADNQGTNQQAGNQP